MLKAPRGSMTSKLLLYRYDKEFLTGGDSINTSTCNTVATFLNVFSKLADGYLVGKASMLAQQNDSRTQLRERC